MKVLICGGRHYNDEQAMREAMADLKSGYDVVIQGGASGADALAKKIATELQIDWHEYPAEWKRFGAKAGPIRNQHMLDHGKPDEVWAFPGGFGTGDMIKRAHEAGVTVREWVNFHDVSPESCQDD